MGLESVNFEIRFFSLEYKKDINSMQNPGIQTAFIHFSVIKIFK